MTELLGERWIEGNRQAVSGPRVVQIWEPRSLAVCVWRAALVLESLFQAAPLVACGRKTGQVWKQSNQAYQPVGCEERMALFEREREFLSQGSLCEPTKRLSWDATSDPSTSCEYSFVTKQCCLR
jgi:hypothetical protein